MFTAVIFDTETPGFTQPGIMQLAGVQVDAEFEVLKEFNHFIIPELYTEVEAGAFAAHGITEAKCHKEGIPLADALDILGTYLSESDVAVCHNYSYDSRVVSKTLNTLGKEDFLVRKRNFCTMKTLTPICKLPGKRGYKWPKLQEAHHFLFGEHFEDAHDAMADVQATLRLLREIKKRWPEELRAA